MRNPIPFKVEPENLKFFRVTRWVYYIGFFGHSLILFSFLSLGFQELWLFNAIISVPAFTIALILNRLGRHNLAFVFAFFELLFHQVAISYYMGWGVGAYFWLVYLGGLCFFNPKWSNKVHFFLLSIIAATVVILHLYCQVGVYKISLEMEQSFFLNNALSVLIFLSLLINYYTRSAYRAESELKEANEELSEKNEEINTQQERIVQSINYAKVIQNAVIPNDEVLQNNFVEHFILFQPTGIVSGDFYWFADLGNQVVVVCADCTGHGVPGGFMSMLGISYLSELVNHQRITEPAQILDQLRDKVKEALQNDQQENQLKDGMDMSVCVFEKENRLMQFAGANNGMMLIRNKELTEYKPTKNPIGEYPKEIPFTRQEIQLEQGDQLYLYTDGYIDQFGGAEGRKFMKKRLKEELLKVSSDPMNSQQKILGQIFENWKNDQEQIDDCTLIGLRV